MGAIRNIGWIANAVLVAIMALVLFAVTQRHHGERIEKLELTQSSMATHAQALSEQVAIDRAVLGKRMDYIEDDVSHIKSRVWSALGETMPERLTAIREEIGRQGG